MSVFHTHRFHVFTLFIKNRPTRMEGGTGVALFALRDALEEVLLGVQREGSAGEAVGERAVFFGDGLHERVPRFEPEVCSCRSFQSLAAW